MTCGAAAFAAIGIDTSDAAIRPSRWIEFAFTEIFHFAAVTLTATVVSRWAAFDNFAQHVVERADELCGGSVMALFKLLRFGGMAPGAIVWRDNNGDLLAVVIESGGIVVVGLVTGITIDAFASMRAGLPLLHNSRSHCFVTL